MQAAVQTPLIPYPPTDLVGDPAVDGIVIAIMSALFACALAYALFQLVRRANPIVLLMFLGGGAMMVMEPMVDTTAGVWFAESSRMFLHGWGRSVPLWVCLTYFVYFGVGSAIIWQMIGRGLTGRQLWMIYAGEVVADVVLETTVLNTGIYVYYGHQPLLLGPFPLWWAAVNALISLSAALAVHQITTRTSGWRLLAIIPAMLCASAGANAAAGWPAWFVINSDLGPVATQIGGIASVALALAGVATAARWLDARGQAAVHPSGLLRTA